MQIQNLKVFIVVRIIYCLLEISKAHIRKIRSGFQRTRLPTIEQLRDSETEATKILILRFLI